MAFRFENFLGGCPQTPQEASAFGARNSFPYHYMSSRFNLLPRFDALPHVFSETCITYSSDVNYLVPIIEVCTPPPPPHPRKFLATGLRPKHPMQILNYVLLCAGFRFFFFPPCIFLEKIRKFYKRPLRIN